MRIWLAHTVVHLPCPVYVFAMHHTFDLNLLSILLLEPKVVNNEVTFDVRAPLNKIWSVISEWGNYSWLMYADSVDIQGDTRIISYKDGSSLKHVLRARDDHNHSIKFEVHHHTGAHALLINDVKLATCVMKLTSKGETETKVTWCSEQLLKADADTEGAKSKTDEKKRMESLKFFKNLFECWLETHLVANRVGWGEVVSV